VGLQTRPMSRSGSQLSTVIGWGCLAALLLPSTWNLLTTLVADDPGWAGRPFGVTFAVIAGAVLAITIAGLMARTPVGLFATALALFTTAAVLVTLVVVWFWAFFGQGSYETSRPHIGLAVTLGATLLCAFAAALLVLDGRGEHMGRQSK